MRYFLVVIIFLSIIRINAACQTDIEFAKITGKVFFKMQSTGSYPESLDFNSRYRWHTYFIKEAELHIKLNSNLSDIYIVLDNNGIRIDRIIVKLGSSKESEKKLSSKNYKILAQENLTILRISREAIKLNGNEVVITYEFQSEEEEVLKYFSFLLNDFNTSKVKSSFVVIIPKYLDYSLDIDVDVNSGYTYKSDGISESFNYFTFKSGKGTTENYRYSSRWNLFELYSDEPIERNQTIKLTLKEIKPVRILN